MSIIANLMNGTDQFFSFFGAEWATGILAIMIMLFIKQSEGIIKKIFGFDNASTLGSTIASGALLITSIKAASTATQAIANKVGAKASGSNSSSKSKSSSKTQPSSNANRNTTNINSANNRDTNTTARETTRQANNTNNTNSQRGQQTSSPTPAGEGTDRQFNENARATSDRGRNSSTDANNSSARGLNTAPNQTKKQRVISAMGKFAAAQARVGGYIAGASIGGMASDDTFMGIGTGMSLARPINEGAAAIGKKAYSKLKDGPRVYRMTAQRNDIIDAYDDLKKTTGWSDDRMYREAETLIKVKNPNKIQNEKRRNFATALQTHRVEFEGRYEEPNDMVLDTIDKIQSGKIKKNTSKIYTRKKNNTK